LFKEKVIIFKGTKKYHIVNKRFFDSAKYLKNKSYDQILFIDGGDTIFQEDITHVFNKDKNTFRVVPLGMEVLFFKWFVFLDSKYNFMMSTEEKGFIVKKGLFYKPNGEKIVIVHNAGQMDFFRPIINFGFGKEYNQINHIIYNVKKAQYQILGWYKKNLKD